MARISLIVLVIQGFLVFKNGPALNPFKGNESAERIPDRIPNEGAYKSNNDEHFQIQIPRHNQEHGCHQCWSPPDK